jgi:hypothetical protein
MATAGMLRSLTQSLTLTVAAAAHGFVVGDVLYNNNGTWAKARANAIATTTPTGVVSTVTDANNFIITLAGAITLSGLTQGLYYLSAATAGLLTVTAPTGVTEFLMPVLYAATSTQGYVIQGFPATLAIPTVAEGGTGATTVAAAWVALNVTANAISALDIDWSLSRVHSKTLAANSTFTFSNAVDGQTIVVVLLNTASNYTVTWPTVKWAGNVAPTQTVGAKYDVYTFVKIGSNIFGSVVQNFT